MTFLTGKFDQFYYTKITLVLPLIHTFHYKHPFRVVTEEDMLL